MADPKAKVTRKLGTITYTESTKQQLRLDQDGILQHLKIRHKFTTTSGSSGPSGAKYLTLARLIKRLELVVNGQDTIINQDGPHIAARQNVERGVRAYGMDATVVTTGSSTVTNYDVVLEVPMNLPRAIQPEDTALDFRKISQAILSIDWGGASDLFGTTNSLAVSNVTTTVEGEFLVFPDPNQGYMVRELNMMEQEVTATNTDLAILQDRGAMFYRSWNVLSVSDTALVNTMLDPGGLIVRSGSFTFADREGVQMRADYADKYGMAVAERPTGVYRFEMPLHGKGTTMINAGNLLADLYLRANVTKVGTTDKLYISREVVRPLALG